MNHKKQKPEAGQKRYNWSWSDRWIRTPSTRRKIESASVTFSWKRQVRRPAGKPIYNHTSHSVPARSNGKTGKNHCFQQNKSLRFHNKIAKYIERAHHPFRTSACKKWSKTATTVKWKSFATGKNRFFYERTHRPSNAYSGRDMHWKVYRTKGQPPRFRGTLRRLPSHWGCLYKVGSLPHISIIPWLSFNQAYRNSYIPQQSFESLLSKLCFIF